ncbi:helix-turn-helix transcriptional regulator [Bacillus atrophaeus]|uniref:helix-turn-helix transcriptional regulator n=1 Tax=Bacillus atrophaeus TaxID=1452 RepID=UPI00039BD20D|nr:phage protein [Bacillus atrophaeus]ASS70079.1 hypothetical protein BaGK_03430 [Bacillus atrophaeus]KAA6442355.1 hypothetical protein DX926_20750 [Bacillus atrophaeus]MCY8948017.1 hypothetical protein [Bacillus atrophaeus]MCY8973611.1 hypothetical protein [Bacillus atrophaeus]MCY9112046.1 hypothetical protein [Bacillus atrophaeus]
MPQAVITFDEMTATVFKDQMEKLFQAAYEKGVEDGRKKYAYPPVLNVNHLTEILSVKRPTIAKITARPDFPKFTEIQARYPRDEVFDWIKRNTAYIKEVTA